MTSAEGSSVSLNFQVTGGSSGIGKSIAIECYRQGAFITLVARDEVSKIFSQADIPLDLSCYSRRVLTSNTQRRNQHGGSSCTG